MNRRISSNLKISNPWLIMISLNSNFQKIKQFLLLVEHWWSIFFHFILPIKEIFISILNWWGVIHFTKPTFPPFIYGEPLPLYYILYILFHEPDSQNPQQTQYLSKDVCFTDHISLLIIYILHLNTQYAYLIIHVYNITTT